MGCRYINCRNISAYDSMRTQTEVKNVILYIKILKTSMNIVIVTQRSCKSYVNTARLAIERVQSIQRFGNLNELFLSIYYLSRITYYKINLANIFVNVPQGIVQLEIKKLSRRKPGKPKFEHNFIMLARIDGNTMHRSTSVKYSRLLSAN